MDTPQHTILLPATPATKTCPKCGKDKSFDDFSNNKRRKDGKQAYCKQCNAEDAKERAEKHPEKRRKQSKKSRLKNKDKNCEKERQRQKIAKRIWRAKHPELSLAHVKKYQEEHPEECRARRHAWYERNKERQITYVDRWRKIHPEQSAEIFQRRRANKNNAHINDLTKEQWALIKKMYGYRCVYCGKKPKVLTQDHIVPLSKGGNHTFDNIVPACKTCNCRKGNRAILCPIESLLPLWSV